MSIHLLKPYPHDSPSSLAMWCAFMRGFIHLTVKATRATQTRAQVAKHARQDKQDHFHTICASLPDDCKLTFAQMLSNFDDLIADDTNGSNSGVAIAGSASLAAGAG
jgi:hypothetical protein